MLRACLISLACLTVENVAAEALVPVRMIRPGDILGPEDLRPSQIEALGALRPGDAFQGLEAGVTLFPGRPVSATDLIPPRLVHRNSIVVLSYEGPGLSIRTEGRALSDGSAGEVVQVINLTSRARLSGIVAPDGRILVNSSWSRP